MKKIILPATIVMLLLIVAMLIPSEQTLVVKWEPVKVETKDATPLIDVYLENSGSMDGYMNDGAQLKDAIYSYVSALEVHAAAPARLHFINSQIIPYEGAAKEFIRNMNPTTFKKAGGNRANSDIAQMLEAILESTSPNSVALFISDCILDVPEGNVEDFFVNRQIDIKNAFAKYRRKRKDLSVEILRLESRFNGMYYYNVGGEELRDVMRPYYIFVIGNKNVLASINKHAPLSSIKHGVLNYAAFTTHSVTDFTVTNEFGVAQNNLVECRQGSRGKCRMNIKANLSPTLQDDAYVMNPDNYRTRNATVSISSVERNVDPQSAYTHVLIVEMDGKMNPAGEQIRLVQQPDPAWLDAANDDTGKEIHKNLKKTTGIKYIIGGIAEAYKEDNTLTEFTFNISKK